MYDSFSDFLKGKHRLCIIQAENPDGDSIGSALALDYLLKDVEISLYCPVDIPKYLRYLEDWSRISNEFDFNADGYIIVDTAADVLLSKTLENPAIRDRLERSPVFILDHHETEDDLNFAHQGLIQTLPACCDLIYRIAIEQGLLSPTEYTPQKFLTQSKSSNSPVRPTNSTKSANSTEPTGSTTNSQPTKLPPEAEDQARESKACAYLYYGILSDTLGLTAPPVTADTFAIIADLAAHGLSIFDLDEKRREFAKKSPRILDYKADLIKRVEYYLDGRLAAVHIPWEDISEYSDEYNPNVLILEELRLVEGVEIAVAIKTYPDGKVTGKIRSSTPVADKIAEYFGGGGHPYASGFRTYDISYEDTVHELIIAITTIANAENANSDLTDTAATIPEETSND